MKLQLGLIVIVVAVSVAATEKPRSKYRLVEMAKTMPREDLLAELKTYLSPAFRNALDDSLIALLNGTLRQFIYEGSPDLGIPVLDPLTLDHVDVNLDVDVAQLSGFADGLRVSGIGGFVIDSVALNLLLLNAGFGFHVPRIEASATYYDIEGVIGDLIPIYGNGSLYVALDGLSITGKIYIGVNNSFIYIKKLELDVGFTSLTTKIEGLLGGGDLSDLINEVISDIAPEVFNNAKPTLLPVVVDAIVTLVNQLLDGVTLSDIIGIITGGGIKKNTVFHS